MAEPDKSLGGQGETFTPESRSDLVLIRRAIKARWPIPDELRRKAVARAEELIDKGEPREAVGALKVLAVYDKLNFDRDVVEMEREAAEAGNAGATDSIRKTDADLLASVDRIRARRSGGVREAGSVPAKPAAVLPG